MNQLLLNAMQNKPIFTSEQLISKMKDKGISFNYTSEAEAIDYLTNNNNFHRLYSYRKNYEKIQNGNNIGKYIQLDFDDLKNLAIIDMLLRKEILQMCIDIEHLLKVKLLADFQGFNDGYTFVQQYFSRYPQLAPRIFDKRNSVYVKDLLKKTIKEVTVNDEYNLEYNGRYYYLPMSIWTLLEIISFGDFTYFYNFFYNNTDNQHQAPVDSSILSCVKSLRNACAHNNCIIYNLKSGTTYYNKPITDFAKNHSITKEQIRKKLSCQAIYEFVCVLYSYDKLAHEGMKKHQYRALSTLVNERIPKYSKNLQNNEKLKTSYDFLKKIIDNLNSK